MKKKHILIVSFAYPPLSAIGSRRIAMLAKGLFDAGYIPHVITAKNPPQKHSIKSLIPDEYVHHVNWLDIWQLKYYLDKFILTKFFGKIIGYFFPFGGNTIPEKRRFLWVKPAINKGLEVIEKYNIELIYSSYTPPASVRVASALKQKTGIPWVNEYRDLWTGNPYVKLSEKKELKNLKIEKKLVSISDALITVSEPLKKNLEKLHNKPTFVIYNGIDKLSNNTLSSVSNSKIRIVYAGGIYKDKRDPEPLFQALKMLKEKNKDLYSKFSVDFYGPRLQNILGNSVDINGINDVVRLHQPVNHNKIIEIQKKADILLLLGWNNKADEGVLTGKIFEYLGMNKPILGIGYKGGAMDIVLQETNTGKIINDPIVIYNYLIAISKLVKNEKNVEGFKENIKVDSYLRSTQVHKLIDVFEKII